MLSKLALVHTGVDYELLKAINPHLPPMPVEVEEPIKPGNGARWRKMTEDEKKAYTAAYQEQLKAFVAYQEALKARLASEAYKSAEKVFAGTLKDLLTRGLLQYDASAYRYDLHPVVRGVARGKLSAKEKNECGRSIVDYFSARQHNPYEHAQTLDDLADGIQLVRTCIEMGEMGGAAFAYQGDLASASCASTWRLIQKLLL